MKRFIILMLIFTAITTFSGAQSPGAVLLRQEGIASWYGGEFDGKPTASGEIFDSSEYTAAHPNLPFGTILVITNQQNEKRVTVRVNDRGPFVAARIIDLSRAAAEALDMLTTGTAPVIVERAKNTALGPGGEPVPAIVAEAPPPEQPVTPAPPATPAQPVTPAPPPEQPPAPPPAPEPAPPPPASPPPVETPPEPVQLAPAPPPVYTPAPVTQPAPTPPPVYTPVPAPAAQPAPVYAPPPAYTPPAYSAPAQPAMSAQPTMPPAVLRGAMPPAGSTKTYRLQVGAYAVPRNAVDAFDKLKNAGLSPAYERNGDLYRVVLPGLRAGEIQRITQILGNIGYREALIREE